MDPVLETGFSFMDSRPEFAGSVRTFLNNTFDPRAPVSAIAELVCQQAEIGTFIVVENGERPEDAIVGFISILDLTVQSPVTQYLIGYLVGKVPKLQEYATARIGLLMSERVLNTPGELIPRLHSEFLKDIEWAQSQQSGSHRYDYLVLCTRYCKLFSEAATQPHKKKKTRVVEEELLFFKLEEEDFYKAAEAMATYQAESGDVSGSDSSASQQYHFTDDQHTEKMVIVLSWPAYVRCVQTLAAQSL